MAYNPNANGRSYIANNGSDATGFNTDLNDKSVYLLDHLATFTVNKSSGIFYPADGMRKLLQMEKTKGIWSQKMHLCIDRQWILILDYDNGKVIERFPASAIQEPTAYISNDPNEIYSNILVFIVGGESRSHSEMHIFQCQSISAIHLVEDIKQMRNDKMITNSVEATVISSSSSNKQNQHQAPSLGENNQGQSPEFNFNATHDDSSSTTSEKFEREVNVLNHCFDDIEKFIARLQTIAAATQDAQNRRRRSKKLDMPVDETRTRPPHEMEFIDIFAKFKLAFNLLGRLKTNIHDPNAPELVHFLFTPLALIVDSTNQTYIGQNIPASVVKPLLSREAINLLTNCITSKETELWHSLGNAWAMPKDIWKEKVPEYKPVFFDGWSPDFPLTDEPETAAPSPSIPKDNNVKDIQVQSALAQLAASTEQYDSDFEDSPAVVLMDRKSVANGHSRKSFVSADYATNLWLEELEARDAKIVQVTYPRTANNEKELTVVRGEFLEILDDSRKWWKARNIQGRVAHVPHTIVAQQPNADDTESLRKISVNSHQYMDENKQRPPTPPPLPPPTLRSTKSRKSSVNEPKGDDMQAELKNVLALFRENRRNYDAVKTPEIFIQQTSNPAQVQQWLKAKGFSENVTTKLHDLSGNELFALKRATLEDYCGVEEGKRLSSQITIQRNVSGYKTTRSSELLAILAKARAKSDQQDDLF
ncbi:unnamed protein product [Diamesa serratosioi]